MRILKKTFSKDTMAKANICKWQGHSDNKEYCLDAISQADLTARLC